MQKMENLSSSSLFSPSCPSHRFFATRWIRTEANKCNFVDISIFHESQRENSNLIWSGRERWKRRCQPNWDDGQPRRCTKAHTHPRNNGQSMENAWIITKFNSIVYRNGVCVYVCVWVYVDQRSDIEPKWICDETRKKIGGVVRQYFLMASTLECRALWRKCMHLLSWDCDV